MTSYEEDPQKFLDQVERCMLAVRAYRNGDMDGAQIVIDGIDPHWVIGFLLAFSVDELGRFFPPVSLDHLIDTHVARVRAKLQAGQGDR